MARLTGKSVVLTGAVGGLGRAITQCFIDEGVESLTLADLDVAKLEQMARELSASGCEVSIKQVDVADSSSAQAMVDYAIAQHGRVDVLINNAGILTPSARVHHVQEPDFKRILEVNLLGVFNGMHAVIPHMRGRSSGSIINTASISAVTAWTHASPYGASKAGVMSLTKTAAFEYAKEGIRINAVCPGTFRTAIHDGLADAAIQAIVDRHPIGRLADPSEIAPAFAYLASDEASFVTGTGLVVDGGYSLP